MLRCLFASALLLASPVLSAAADSPSLAVWKGHTHHVYGAAFTPDGSRVLSVSEDRTVRVWDVASGKVLATWRGHTGEVLAVAISPDGKYALSGGEDRLLKIWDISSGRELASLPGHQGEIRAIAISPDGRLAATTSYAGELKLWDIRERREAATLQQGALAHAAAVAFSPDGKRLLTGQGDKTLRLWDVAARRQLAVWRGHANKVMAVAFSPDGRRALSGGRDNTLRLWDTADGSGLAVWKGHKSYIYAVAFSPDGRTALSAGADYAVRHWEVATGRELAVWGGHLNGVRDVAFSPDGSLAVSASEDHSLRLWDVSGTRPHIPAAGAPRLPIDTEERLGKVLFFDQRLSGDASRNCADCHRPEQAFTDGLALSPGYPETLYFRNTPTLFNSGGQKYLYWDGRFPGDDLPSLIRDHISEAHFMGADGRLVVEKLRQAPDYVEAFQRVYGAEPSYARMLEALSAFVRSLRSGEAPYDRFLRGEKKALSRAARRGYRLFTGEAGCVRCHDGPLLTDGGLHNRGVPENPEVQKNILRLISFRRFFKVFGIEGYANLQQDIGYYAVTKDEADRGKFRTPSLREVARTAPYMHNGMFNTLEEAVGFENPRLSRRQKRDLAEFLKSLSSETPVVEFVSSPGDALRPRREKAAAPREQPGEIAAAAPPPLGPLPPVPVPGDNPLTPAKVELGKLLFFEPRLSGNGDSFCAACHEPAMGWGDGAELALGYSGTLDWRNSQTILNAAYYSKLEWDGTKPSLEEQARSAIISNLNGNGDPELVEERLATSPEYVAMFKEVFGVERPNFEGVLRAIAAFERAVPVSRNAPFDRGVLSPAAQRGRRLFEGKAGCLRCHNGPLASDQGFHATGVPHNPRIDEMPLRQVTVRYKHVIHGAPEEVYRAADSDPGLYLMTHREADSGKFRTPSLRELKYTAPYMHNGIFATLAEVVDFYDRGGGDAVNKTPLLAPLRLAPDEKKDLIAFLESLSGDEIVIPSPKTPESYPAIGG
ncbi:MAG: cytochrome c peroxidase [Elusimicrobiota bacterium]